jgi:hypothetical protein
VAVKILDMLKTQTENLSQNELQAFRRVLIQTWPVYILQVANEARQAVQLEREDAKNGYSKPGSANVS